MAELDCNEALHVLYHYLDGELTEERRVVIQQHLDECPPCYEGFEFEYELKQVIRMRCRERTPEGLRDRIAELIRHESLNVHPEFP
jgi:mycothiol system anti-sigma-R factor